MKSGHIVKSMSASLAALTAASAVLQAPAALAQSADVAPAASAASLQPPAPTVSTAPQGLGSQPGPQANANQYAQAPTATCVDQRASNTAAGAVVGGALGAITGAALTGRGGGAAAGGAIGALTGAAVGSSTPSCPPGYAVRYGTPVPYAPVVAYGPAPTWVWVGDRWVYEPYPAAYWGPVYWRGGWAGRPWIVRRHW